MSRKITQQATAAFLNATRFSGSNTTVLVEPNVTILCLFGNKIAYRYKDSQNTLSITNAGCKSNTTKERLNALPGVFISQKKGVWYLNGEVWDGELIDIVDNSIKTIDIQGREWFDKVNGNSYFSARVTTNFGLVTEKTYYVPFQYGYGDSYQYESIRQLQTAGVLPQNTMYAPTSFCRDNGIILRASKQDGCLQRDVKAWGSN